MNIYCIENCVKTSIFSFFALFSKSDGGFHWNGLTINVWSNKINNSAQLKDRELRLLVLLLLIILGMISSAAMECDTCVCFFRKVWVFWEKNPLKFWKTEKNEKLTVRPWKRQWNHVTHGQTVRIERSGTSI